MHGRNTRKKMNRLTSERRHSATSLVPSLTSPVILEDFEVPSLLSEKLSRIKRRLMYLVSPTMSEANWSTTDYYAS